jgi:hypothetical protein
MKSCILVGFLLVSHQLSAQFAKNDSIFRQKAISHSIEIYHQSLGDQSGLYNGSLYSAYQFKFKENSYPYFYKDYAKGSVVYDQVLYTNVDLLYDEVADVVILKDGVRQIRLIKEKISHFSIENNEFVHLEKDNSNNINSGFYRALYSGKTKVLKKEVKIISEVLNSFEGIERFVKTEQYYFIKSNNEYNVVNRKKDVSIIFKDHKKEIQQYIKSNKLDFKNERDNFLIKVCTFYDELSK